MSKQYTVQAPDGKTITIEGPEGASEDEVIRQAQSLYQPAPQISPEELASRQAASKASFEANQPSLVGGFLRSVGEQVGNVTNIKQNLKNLGSAVMNPTSGNTPVSTGLESTGNLLTDTALGLAGGYGLAKGINALPNTARAASGLESVMQAAKNIPVDTSKMTPALSRIQELAARGAENVPSFVNKLGEAIENGPLTYEAARDFASSAGKKISGLARMVNPPDARVEAQVSLLAKALGDANRDAAASVGMGDLYDSAMKEYRQAQGLKSFANIAAKTVAASAIGGGAFYKISKLLGY